MEEKLATNKENKIKNFFKKYWYIIPIIILLIAYLSLVAYQFSYAEKGLTLPNSMYGNENVGERKRSDILARDQKVFHDAEVMLDAGNYKEKVSILKLGATFREDESFNRLSNYSFLAKITPFSLWLKQPKVESLDVNLKKEVLNDFAKQISKKAYKEPKSATIKIENGEVKVTKAIPGEKINPKDVGAQIKHLHVKVDKKLTNIDIKTDEIKPEVVASDFNDVANQAKNIIKKQIQINVVGHSENFNLDKKQIASVLDIVKNEKTKKPELNIKKDGVAEISEMIDKKVGRPAGKTIIKIVDGNVVGKDEGEKGFSVNQDELGQKLKDSLFGGDEQTTFFVNLKESEPKVEKQTTYSHSQAGLQAKIDDFGKKYDVRISLRQLNGNGWTAGYRSSEQTVSASTYKLYIAINILEKIENGEIKWSDSMRGMDVAGCFHEMIIISANGCAEDWLGQIGRQNLDNYIHERGISKITTFTSSGATKTSADDLVRVLGGIYNGSLAKGDTRAKILDMLAHQKWRYGIPVGTSGWTSDKVGFLWGYIHDAGIVHTAKGDYIMAVMTKGASYSLIAQITRELEAIMYP